MMSEREFTYNRIDLDRPSFRLIRLLGGTHSDIECELFDAYLDDVQNDGIPYEALSYTWDGIEKAARIRINGMNISVTENLFAALQYLRIVDNDRIFWIDAICIDQDNHIERGHQIQQMRDIYRIAERVIVWLGAGTQDSDILMDFLMTLPLEIAERPASAHMPIYLQIYYCESLERLLNRPWFRRIWVVQEVANARRADIVCGWRRVSTRIFTVAPSLLGLRLDFHSKAVLDVISGRLREKLWYSQQPTLRTLIQNFQGSEASDERDMIYALLRMSSSEYERNSLRADYGKDLQELIRDTTAILLFLEYSGTPSLCYINWGWYEFVRSLKSLSSAAFTCAIRRQVTELEGFLDWDEIDVNWKDEDRRTPLWWASERGNSIMVKRLVIRHDIEVNSKDKRCSLKGKLTSPKSISAFEPEQ